MRDDNDNQQEAPVNDAAPKPEAGEQPIATPPAATPPAAADPEKPKRTRGPSKPKEPEVQVPSLGRIVRYVTAALTIRPAIITAVHSDGEVDLTVFNSQGAVAVVDVPFEESGEDEHTFHWPQAN